MNPNDLGNISPVSENCQRININSLVRLVRGDIVRVIVSSLTNISNQQIELVTSETGFGGKRLWFRCPNCLARVGVLYQLNKALQCRKCHYVKYKKQRFKGMLESLI